MPRLSRQPIAPPSLQPLTPKPLCVQIPQGFSLGSHKLEDKRAPAPRPAFPPLLATASTTPLTTAAMPTTHQAIETVWKAESTRLIAGIARVTRDIGLAEELAQDAFSPPSNAGPPKAFPKPCRLAHDRRQAPRHRQLPPQPHARPQARRNHPRAGTPAATARATPSNPPSTTSSTTTSSA